MGWCNHCEADCPTIRDCNAGYICCVNCGKILDQNLFSDGLTFDKITAGASRATSMRMERLLWEFSESRWIALDKGKDEIYTLMTHLQMGGGDSLVNQAHLFYTLAVDKNFTMGHKAAYVAAACLYLVCRKMKEPYLLIDFSDCLQTNVYVLGAVFLQLCEVLYLEDHPLIENIVDPSLFIHRFTECLLDKKNNGVSRFQRKNNAVSETALRIVASMKRDWMQTGRNPSGLCGAALYISALSHGLSYSKSDIVTVVHICETTLTKQLIGFEKTESGCLTIEEFIARADELDEEFNSTEFPVPGQVLCKHRGTEEPHFAHGLCRLCYDEFNKISGGLTGGAEPPAFQHAERQRMEKAAEEEKTKKLGHDIEPCDTEHDSAHVVGHLHNEEDKRYKTVIWESMNREYLEEEAAKEAVAAKEGVDVSSKPRKERKRKCSEDANNPDQTSAEATYKALNWKDPEEDKRPKTGSDVEDYDADGMKIGIEDDGNALESRRAEDGVEQSSMETAIML